jgi:hypothetical protein
MRNIFLVLALVSLYSGLRSQTSEIKTEVHTDLNFANLLVSVTSSQDSLAKLWLSIFSADGQKIKEINLPDSDKKLSVSIPISDLPYGNYTYVLTRHNEKIFSGTFVKDVYDSLDN